MERANSGIEDPAFRLVRAICVYVRFAIDDPERARVLARIHNGHTSLGAPLNRGLVEDVAAGIASGRFAIVTSESGVLFVLGASQTLFVHVLRDPGLSSATALAQQMCALILRGFGLRLPEAERLAAQASDQLVRLGAGAVAP